MQVAGWKLMASSENQRWLERVERVLALLKRPPRFLERDGAPMKQVAPSASGIEPVKAP
jgi:hypothetical protein